MAKKFLPETKGPVSTYLPYEERVALKKLSEKQGNRQISSIMRQAIKELLQKEGFLPNEPIARIDS